MTAFENGSLDERTCGHRIQDLTIKVDQLKVRQEELRQMCLDLPQPPSPKAVERLRQDLVHVLTQRTPGQRKAVIESHIAEIKIDGDRLTPIYKIPIGEFDQNGEEPADISTDSSFRIMVRVVE